MSIRKISKDFPACPVAKTLSTQCRGPGFNPWLGNWIPHAETKSSNAAIKDPACCNQDPVQPNK